MSIVKFELVESKVVLVAGERVIIALDAAELYGVQTNYLNKVVKKNPDKFPEGYLIELTKEQKNELIINSPRLDKLKYSPYSIKAFTEKGLYMLATVLKGEKATQTTIAIIETFAKIKELSNNINEIAGSAQKSDKQKLIKKGGAIIGDLFRDDLPVNATETTIEVNFAMLKLKRTVKRSK